MLEKMKIDDNFIGLVSCDEIKEILKKKDEALEIADSGMYIIGLSNNIDNKINISKNHCGINKELDFIRSLNRGLMMSYLKSYWNERVWQLIAEKYGIYTFMDEKTLRLWAAKVTYNHLPEPTIENVKKEFKWHFSNIKTMIEDNVTDLQSCFKFICQYPYEIVVKYLICENPFYDGNFDKEKEYIDNKCISNIHKLLKACCMLNNDFDALKKVSHRKLVR